MFNFEGQPKSLGIIQRLEKCLTPGGRMDLRLEWLNHEVSKYCVAFHDFSTALEPYEKQTSSLPLNQEEILRIKETSNTSSTGISTKVTAEQTEQGLVITLDEKVIAFVPVSPLMLQGSIDCLGNIVCNQFVFLPMLSHEINRVLFPKDKSKPMLVGEILVKRGKKITCPSVLDTLEWTDERLVKPEEITDKNTVINVLNKLTAGLTS